jgi:hypothetical protein
VGKCNLSEIVEGFDPNEYIKGLGEQSQAIAKHWSSWKIETEEDLIEVVVCSLCSCSS